MTKFAFPENHTVDDDYDPEDDQEVVDADHKIDEEETQAEPNSEYEGNPGYTSSSSSAQPSPQLPVFRSVYSGYSSDDGQKLVTAGSQTVPPPAVAVPITRAKVLSKLKSIQGKTATLQEIAESLASDAGIASRLPIMPW